MNPSTATKYHSPETPQQYRVLDSVVQQAHRLRALFELPGLPDEERGACTTYSLILAEVLGEYGIKAEVRAVFIITANRAALDAARGKITREEAIKRDARIQVWGDIERGQSYQHAVCYIPDWNVVVDLGMTRRASRLVPSHPYWAEVGKFPWWLVVFEFRTYRLEYAAYETQPGAVEEAKKILRKALGKGPYLRS